MWMPIRKRSQMPLSWTKLNNRLHCNATYNATRFSVFIRNSSIPDRSAVYMQCGAVYTACLLNAKQCSCRVDCQYCIYTEACRYTAVWSGTSKHSITHSWTHRGCLFKANLLFTAHHIPERVNVAQRHDREHLVFLNCFNRSRVVEITC